jgi:hypothetical protein
LASRWKSPLELAGYISGRTVLILQNGPSVLVVSPKNHKAGLVCPAYFCGTGSSVSLDRQARKLNSLVATACYRSILLRELTHPIQDRSFNFQSFNVKTTQL